MRAGLVLLVLCAAAGFAGAQESGLELTLRRGDRPLAPGAEVDFGAELGIDLVRRAAPGAALATLDPERDLPGFGVRSRTLVSRREDARGTEEHWRLDARVFVRPGAEIPAPRLAIVGEPPREIASARPVLVVRSVLPANDPGTPESAGPLRPAPFEWRRALPRVALGLALAGLLAITVLAVRRRLAARRVAPALTPIERARAVLARLATREADDPRAALAGQAAVLRDFLAGQLVPGALGMTQRQLAEEETLRRDLGEDRRAALLASLARSEAAAFAGRVPDAAAAAAARTELAALRAEIAAPPAGAA
ncbi:MAG: hypothetical protein R3F20_02755 [Planctomycetota bacterium]